MSKAKVGVIQFPGLNCESETLRTLEQAGVNSTLIRWNEPASRLVECAGFVIPGGFSYQDRVRAGVIAAKSSLMEAIAREVEKGKPILGICNGAQILVEAGLAPGSEPGRVDVALTRNHVPGWEGYHARWIFVQPGSGSSFFTEGCSEPLPMVVAHGEGCFLTDDEAIWRAAKDDGRQALVYCHHDGEPATGFPTNPNGSPDALAGMSGLDGQVLAFMPHPERAARLLQVPEDLPGEWGERRRAAAGDFEALSADGPGMAMLKSFARLNRAGAA